MESWYNGDRAEKVREIINRNFNTLESYLSNNILALSTEKRLLLPSQYLRAGLIVFDTDTQKWLKYNGQIWEDYAFPNTGFFKEISLVDWSSSNTINIPFPEHHTPNPDVSLYILNNGKYEIVYGGVDIDSNYNITLLTDLAFTGKVVVK